MIRVRLIYSTKGLLVVTNGTESSLVSEVKEKQDQDPIFLELKANVHKQRVLDFEQGEKAFLDIKVDCVYQWWMDSNKGSWMKLIVHDNSFIRVRKKYMVIWEKYIGVMVWKKALLNLLLRVQISNKFGLENRTSKMELGDD